MTSWQYMTKEQIKKHLAGCKACGGKIYREYLCKLCWELKYTYEEE